MAQLRDQGIEAGGNMGSDGGRRLRGRNMCGKFMRVFRNPFQRRFQAQGGLGRIFLFSQASLRRVRSALRFNQSTA
jgi:hypothetical protein